MVFDAAMIALLAGMLPGQPAVRGDSSISLVVLVTVDQMRADYLARYAGQWSGGFARIYNGGTVFEHGQQDHGATETAPGHSTLLSGRYPAHTGVVLNSRGVQDPSSPVLGTADTVGASPRRFRGTTLYDWLLARDAGTRVLSVSRKDRAAIFPIGRARVPVYWLYNGTFNTSRYYADSLPAWVQAFNRRIDLNALTNISWNLLLPESSYAEPDSFGFENGGADFTFPHRPATVPGAVARRLNQLPWIDSLTLDFALQGVQALGLGRRGRPDLLSISLSTTDAVGHAFGPDSREIHDQLLRVDHWLGQFLDSLGRLLPNANTVLVLTADHGVTSLPEYTVTVRHRPAGRVSLAGVARGARAFGVESDGGLLFANLDSLRGHGVKIDSVSQALAAEALALPGVAQVYTPRSLAQAPAADAGAALWRHLLPADYGWLVSATTKPGYVWSSGGLDAEHSSANQDDIEVPIAFYGKSIAAQKIQRPVSTTDIAPTLAALLGITPTEPVDGHTLTEVFGRASAVVRER